MRVLLIDYKAFVKISVINKMAERSQTALQKMQQIANRLISNDPELERVLDTDSALRGKRPATPTSKKQPNFLQKSPNPYLSSSSNKQEMTSNDFQERNKELVHDLQKSRDRIFALEEQISIVKQRFVEREIQYRNIIEQLQDEIRSKTSLDNTDRNRMQHIGDLHKQIQDNIGAIQHKTSKILIEQEADIRRFFHKKMNEMKEKFKEDKINKNQKDQEFIQKQKQLLSELEWIKNIAHKIDLENQTLTKKYTTLKSQYEIQEKDKDLLMKQLLMKKKENAVLKSQVEQYQKLLNEVSKEMEENDAKANQSSQIMLDSSVDYFNSSKPKGFAPQNNKNNSKRLNSNLGQSRLTNSIVGKPNNGEKYEKTISHLNNMINKEKKKVREIKNLYMKEVGSRSQLEKIIRKLVDDIRESIVEVDRERSRRKRGEDEMSQISREKLLEELLANEKVLTLIYDKAFYSGSKSPNMDKMPEQLEKILENNDEDGFY